MADAAIERAKALIAARRNGTAPPQMNYVEDGEGIAQPFVRRGAMEQWMKHIADDYGEGVRPSRGAGSARVLPLSDAARRVLGDYEAPWLEGTGELLGENIATGRSLAAGAAQNLMYWPGGGLPVVGAEATAGAVDGDILNAFGSVEYGLGKTINPSAYPPDEARPVWEHVEGWKKGRFDGARKGADALAAIEGELAGGPFAGSFEVLKGLRYYDAVQMADGTKKGKRMLKEKMKDANFKKNWPAIKEMLIVHDAYNVAGNQRALQGVLSMFSPKLIRHAGVNAASVGGALYDDIAREGEASPDDREQDAQTGGALGMAANWLLRLKAKRVLGKHIGDVSKVPEGAEDVVNRALRDDPEAMKDMPGVAIASANPKYANALVGGMRRMTERQRGDIAGGIDNATGLLSRNVMRSADDSKLLEHKTPAAQLQEGRWQGMSGELKQSQRGMEEAVRRDIYSQLDETVTSSDKDVGAAVYIKGMNDKLKAAMRDYEGADLVPLRRLRRLLRARGKAENMSDADKKAFEADKKAAVDNAAQRAREAYRNSDEAKALNDGGAAGAAQVKINAERAAEEAASAMEKKMSSPRAALVNDIINARSRLQNMKMPDQIDGHMRGEILKVVDDVLKDAMGENNFKLWETARGRWRGIVETFDDKKLGGLMGLERGGDVAKVRKNLLKGGGEDDAGDTFAQMYQTMAKGLGRGDVEKGAARAAEFLTEGMNDKEAMRWFSDVGNRNLYQTKPGMDVLMDKLGERAFASFREFGKKAAGGDMSALDALDKMKPGEISALRASAIKRGNDPALVDRTMQAAYLQAKFRDMTQVAARGAKAEPNDMNRALSKGLHELLGTFDEGAARRFDELFPAKAGSDITPRMKYTVLAAMTDGLHNVKSGEEVVSPFEKSQMTKRMQEVVTLANTAMRPLYFAISEHAAAAQLTGRVLSAVLEGKRHEQIVSAMVRKGIGGDKTASRKLKGFVRAVVDERKDAGEVFRRWYLAEAQADETVKEILERKNEEDNGGEEE